MACENLTGTNSKGGIARSGVGTALAAWFCLGLTAMAGPAVAAGPGEQIEAALGGRANRAVVYRRDQRAVTYDTNRSVALGRPKPVSGTPLGAYASDLTAAFTDGNTNYYFLATGQYLSTNATTGRIIIPPSSIRRDWRGLGPYANKIQAAFHWKASKVMFFLSDGTYVRYDLAAKRVDPGYPRPVDNSTWPGLGPFAGKIGAAFKWSNDWAVFFGENDQYFVYDINADKVDSVNAMAGNLFEQKVAVVTTPPKTPKPTSPKTPKPDLRFAQVKQALDFIRTAVTAKGMTHFAGDEGTGKNGLALNSGRTITRNLGQLPAGYSYWLVAAGDAKTGLLDIKLIDGNNRQYNTAATPNYAAGRELTFEPKTTQVYRVAVTMSQCNANPCRWGLIVMQGKASATNCEIALAFDEVGTNRAQWSPMAVEGCLVQGSSTQTQFSVYHGSPSPTGQPTGPLFFRTTIDSANPNPQTQGSLHYNDGCAPSTYPGYLSVPNPANRMRFQINGTMTNRYANCWSTGATTAVRKFVSLAGAPSNTGGNFGQNPGGGNQYTGGVVSDPKAGFGLFLGILGCAINDFKGPNC